MQYSASFGWHAVDLLPTFYFLNQLKGIFQSHIIPSIGSFSHAYQSYLNSFILSGNPNDHRLYFSIPRTINWPKPTNIDSQFIGNVLDVRELGFSTTTDVQVPKDRYDFWTDIGIALTNLGGYAVPGAVLEQQIVVSSDDPSENFETRASLEEVEIDSLAIIK